MGVLTSIARKVCLNHLASGRVTGFLPLGKIQKVVVIVDGSLPDAQETVDAIRSFAPFKSRQVEVLVMGGGKVACKGAVNITPDDVNFYGRIKRGRKHPKVHIDEDLLVSLVSDPENFTATQVVMSSYAIFKLGRFHGSKKELFDIVVLGDEGGQLKAFELVCDILKSVE